ncbi:MAG: 50S ribosomal protein L20 [Candidatus Omnitrophica bacterium]|nr:50S ribosomal protein L20 [Candidatus Omnitrophota bacterium]
MPRSTNNPATRRRKNKIFKRAKGFVGGRRRLLRTATETVRRAMRFATRDRKQRKRHMRQLWIIRVNAACREYGTTFSRFIHALNKANVRLNRKSLAELAVRDETAIQKLVQTTLIAQPASKV